MCDFGISEIILAVSLAATAASTTLGVVSSVEQGKAQQAQYDYQTQVAANNAKIAENNAAAQRQQGIEESRMQRIKTMQAVGSQQAAMAANGLDVTQGTPLDVIEDTAAMGELDALNTQYNYEEKARAYYQKSNNFTNQAAMDSIAGKNAYSAGIMNAAATGFNGLGSSAKSVAGYWYK
ncbi:MAG: hypothetical protein PHV37_09035 [Candidatus Gastranaerophilales bacterium]|nr:hypothetical protein [Candidatus Gastranaerophilales bacterium]